MTVKDMHYDFKVRVNKIDSQQYRNLKIQEIDRLLNEAMIVFIKSSAEPIINSSYGFETNQREIDDIRTIVKDELIDSQGITPSPVDSYKYIAALPADYMYFTRAYITAYRGSDPDSCKKLIRARVKRHDDMHRESPFDSSSFEWGEINVEFAQGGVTIFTDGTFTPSKLRLSYIRYPLYINNSQSVAGGGGYQLPNGTSLTVNQDCELPNQVHGNIVDIAVAIATGNLQVPDYQYKFLKTKIDK
jgi:hypothetical protein